MERQADENCEYDLDVLQRDATDELTLTQKVKNLVAEEKQKRKNPKRKRVVLSDLHDEQRLNIGYTPAKPMQRARLMSPVRSPTDDIFESDEEGSPPSSNGILQHTEL